MEKNKTKIWHRVEIPTGNQKIFICPDMSCSRGLVLAASEPDGSISKSIMLNRPEMELLIAKMEEMMKYVES